MSRYDDIIDLEHHVSKTRPRMSMTERAAQFSPFAALTGFGAVIDEAARLTETRIELDETARSELDARLRRMNERIVERPAAAITYFLPDEKKAGGAYVTAVGRVKRIDPIEGKVFMESGETIPIGEIVGVDEACRQPPAGDI